jgi:hypothetical protein
MKTVKHVAATITQNVMMIIVWIVMMILMMETIKNNWPINFLLFYFSFLFFDYFLAFSS